MKKPARRPPRKLARRNLTREQLQGRSEDIRRAYFQIFGTEEGRLVLEDMAERYNVWKGTLTVINGAVDTNAMTWAEGRRSVVLDVYERIEDGREGHVPDGPRSYSGETEEQAV